MRGTTFGETVQHALPSLGYRFIIPGMYPNPDHNPKTNPDLTLTETLSRWPLKVWRIIGLYRTIQCRTTSNSKFARLHIMRIASKDTT